LGRVWTLEIAGILDRRGATPTARSARGVSKGHAALRPTRAHVRTRSYEAELASGLLVEWANERDCPRSGQSTRATPALSESRRRWACPKPRAPLRATPA